MPRSIRFLKGSATGSGRLGKFAKEENIFKIVRNKNGLKLLLAMVSEDSGPFPEGSHACVMAYDIVNDFFKSDLIMGLKREDSDRTVQDGIREVFSRINSVIYSQGIKEGQMVKLSLTLIVAVEDVLYGGHSGAGRILLMKGNDQQQLTQDNSWLSRAIKDGKLTVDMALQAKESENNPFMGMEGKVHCQIIRHQIDIGSKIALFTDGIGEFIPNSEVPIIFGSTDSLDDACERLVSISKERGLSDNATILAFSAEEAKEKEKEQEYDEKAPHTDEKKKEKGSSCSIIYFFIVFILLIAISAGSYVGYRHAKKLMTNLFSPPSPVSSNGTIDPDLMETGKNILVKDKDTINLNFFRLNGKKLEPTENRYEITEDYNRLEILPVLEKGTYTLSVKINSKNYYEIHEGSSRNKINLFEDNVKIYLTKGALLKLTPDEIRGVTVISVSGLLSPVRVSFSKQNLIVKALLDSPELQKPDSKKPKEKPTTKPIKTPEATPSQSPGEETPADESPSPEDTPTEEDEDVLN